MLRTATASFLLIVSIQATALSIKHSEHMSVVLDGLQTISSGQQKELREKLHRAAAACISPPDFVVMLELITQKENSANSVAQTAIIKNHFIANGVPTSLIFEGEISAEQFRSRQATHAPVRAVEVGSVEVEIVCTAKE